MFSFYQIFTTMIDLKLYEYLSYYDLWLDNPKPMSHIWVRNL